MVLINPQLILIGFFYEKNHPEYYIIKNQNTLKHAFTFISINQSKYIQSSWLILAEIWRWEIKT